MIVSGGQHMTTFQCTIRYRPRSSARFTTAATDLHAVSQWLAQNEWTVVTSEVGYIAKTFPALSDEDRTQVGEFLQLLEDHDDVHRVWAAIR